MHRRSLIALICALAVLAPAGSSAHPGTRQQLDRIEAEIEEKKELIEEANRERRGILAELAESDERRATLSERIEDLAAELSQAEDQLAFIQASLEVARRELRRWTDRLSETEAELEGQQATLADRAAAAYKLGPSGFLDLIIGSADVRALTDRFSYVSSVLDADSYLLRTIEVTSEQVGEQRGRIAQFEDQLATERDRLAREVERIEQLKAEQQALRAEVDEEISFRKGLLEDVELERQKWIQAVKELEAESARISGMIQAGGSTGSGNPNARFHWPAPGPITSGFGWRTHPIFGTQRFHSGVDIDSECGDPIWAGEDGTVISAGWNGGYGMATVVDHGDGLSTLYAHQSALGVSVGQRVSRAQRIGVVGTTGWSTGCHLHFEVRVNGNPVDPAPYLS
jgi:murein DD-endopeptidase MepM/ murein hydrolase activator NlpD